MFLQRRIIRSKAHCLYALKVHKNAVDGAIEKTEDLADFFSGKSE
jgi:hypothetical protein